MAKSKTIGILVILLVVSILSTIFIANRQVENRTLSEVYSQVIVHRDKPWVESAAVRCESEKQFYVSESNVYPILMKEAWQEISSALPSLQNYTWVDFLQTNSKPSRFPDNLQLTCAYTLLNLKDNGFENSSSCPIRSFSRIGFNENKSQALVLMSQSCGNSVSGLYLLDQIDGRWKVTGIMSIHSD